MKKARYIIVCLFLILTLLLPGCELLPDGTSPTSTVTTTTTASPINPGWTLPTAGDDVPVLPSIADVVALVKPSVVAINTEYVTYDIFNRPSTEEGAGSGWIIDSNGIIVTNNHVVEGAENITVTLADDRTFPAIACCTDDITDLAVIKIDASNLPVAKIGDSAVLQVGDWLVAIGNPLGLGISAKEGIASRLDVSISISGQTLSDLIETSAAINPGNSGGPLVNMKGEVIGITSAKIATVGVEGLGYAISTATAVPIIEELVQTGYIVRPWLGVVMRDVDQFLVLRYNLAVDSGAFITEVGVGSPADEAGLQPGDVVVAVDGAEITTAQDLMEAIHSSQIGQTVEITFWRGESQQTTSATFIERPLP